MPGTGSDDGSSDRLGGVPSAADAPPARRALVMVTRVFLPFAFGYFLSYLFRTINAVIAPQLVADIGLAASDLGLLTGVYFVTFAAAQLPLGIALDRWGPRRTEATVLLVAVAGALVFAQAESFAGVIAGRALIGLGVSACLMAAFKAYVVWFPSDRLPLVNGWQMAAGGLGALAATTPVAALLDLIGWRGVFFAAAALALLAAALIFLLVPEQRRPAGHVHASLGDSWQGTRRVFASGYFWRVAPMTFTSQAGFMAMHGLWLGPWLRDVAQLPADAVARQLMIVALAMVAGFVCLGWAGARSGRRGVGPVRVSIAAVCVFVLVQVPLVAGSTWALPLVLALFGFFGTAGIVAYAGLTQSFPAALAGRVNTAINLLCFLGAFLVQWGMGWVIDRWPAPAPGHYALEGYQTAFGLILAAQVAGVAWYALYRRQPPRPAVPAG